VVDQHATAAPAPTFPPGRYGRRRSPRPRRTWLVWLVAVLIALAAGSLTLRLYRQYGNPDHRGQVTAESDRTDDHVTFRYEVRNRAGTGPASCHVRALDGTGATLGEADLSVPGDPVVTGEFTLPVRSRPASVEIIRCVAAPDRP
jgi:hypothetical protein